MDNLVSPSKHWSRLIPERIRCVHGITFWANIESTSTAPTFIGINSGPNEFVQLNATESTVSIGEWDDYIVETGCAKLVVILKSRPTFFFSLDDFSAPL